jgi:enediyne biosynthesis protein E4
MPSPARALALALLLPISTIPTPSAAPATPKPVTPPIPAAQADWFEDVTHNTGITFVHQFCHHRIANILLSNGSGGAVFDYDNDGYMDIFLVNWGPLEGVTSPAHQAPRQPNRLYRNRGDGTFQDVTLKAGLEGSGFGSAATTGDFDNDGHTDLYVVNIGPNILYRNRGDGTFQDVTQSAGVGHPGAGISATFADVDNDGFLDLYLGNYLTYTPEADSEQNPGAYPGPLAYPGEPNVLYRNRGNGSFEEVTRTAGLYEPRHRNMAVTAFDSNRDGFPDLYDSNDDTPNALWLNNGKGQFRDVALELGVAFNSIGEAPGSMNATIGDANNNGLPDLFITRLGYGSLYLQNPKGYYDDRMWASGLGQLTQKYVAWGGEFIDFDNDGDLDLLVANGDAFQLDGTTSLLLENDGQARFHDASAAGGAFFKSRLNARGNAILDLDNDGRLDALITLLADRPVLLRNRHPAPHHWLKIRLEGTRSNRNGYGAHLTLHAGPLVLHAQARCPTGFLMQGDPRVHFGLGTQSRVDQIVIRWPSGTTQTLANPPTNQILTLREPQP